MLASAVVAPRPARIAPRRLVLLLAVVVVVAPLSSTGERADRDAPPDPRAGPQAEECAALFRRRCCGIIPAAAANRPPPLSPLFLPSPTPSPSPSPRRPPSPSSRPRRPASTPSATTRGCPVRRDVPPPPRDRRRSRRLGQAFERASSVKFAALPAAATREELTDAWRSWVQQVVDDSGAPPPGNLPDQQATWAPKARAAAAPPPEIKLTPG